MPQGDQQGCGAFDGHLGRLVARASVGAHDVPWTIQKLRGQSEFDNAKGEPYSVGMLERLIVGRSASAGEARFLVRPTPDSADWEPPLVREPLVLLKEYTPVKPRV